MWESMFGIASIWAIGAWAALILLPRKRLLLSAVFYAGVGLLCLAYAVLLSLVVTNVIGSGAGDGEIRASFASIAGVRAIFASDAGVTIGWIHYLAFDLFVGLWIARDADQKKFSRFVQAPVLALTFFAGPAGLLVWMVVREKRARKTARASS